MEMMGYAVEMSRPGTKWLKQVDLYGLWDLIGFRMEDVLCVQVKTNQWPSVADCVKMKLWRCPPGVRREIWRFRDGVIQPDIRIL